MRTTVWIVGLVLLVGCQRNRARDCAPYAHDPVLDVCVCPEGTLRADGGDAPCVAYDGGMPISCAGGAAAVTVFADADGDGHGSPETERMGCPGEPGTSMLGDDCDDACADCHPGGTEICDGEDNDCASGADDTFACVQGTTTACTTTCGTEGTGACSTECTMPAVCAPPVEVCNEADDDCDELVDEGVLTFAEPGEWRPDGAPLLFFEHEGGLVLVSQDVRGFHLERYDSAGVRVELHIAVVPGNFSAAAAAMGRPGHVLVAGIEDSTRAIVIAEIEVVGAVVTQGPRTLGVRPSGGGYVQIRVAHASNPLVVYNTATQLFSRGGPWTGTFREQVIASNVRGFTSYAVLAPADSFGTAYVAFAATVDGDATTDSELLVQRISVYGELLGPVHRVTDNGAHDVDPTLAWNGSALAVTWFQAPDDASFRGREHVHVVTPAASGPWSVLGASVLPGEAAVLGYRRIAARADGWLAYWTWTDATNGHATISSVSYDGTRSSVSSNVDSPETGSVAVDLAGGSSGIHAMYVPARPEDEGAILVRRLGCP